MSDASPQPASTPSPNAPKSMDAIMALCKRRGFIYQASEIYGGINGFWDYGPLGAQLKKNLREAWWQDMIMNPAWGRKGPNGDRVRCVPLETCIIQHPKVWEASGHVGGFNDPMQTCKQCKRHLRSDQLRSILRDASWHQDLIDAINADARVGSSLGKKVNLEAWLARGKGKKAMPGFADAKWTSRDQIQA